MAFGEFERARRLIDESARCANELGHPASIASALFFKTVIESRRGDNRAAQVAVESLRALTHEHNLKTYADLGEVYANWAHGKDSDPEAGASGLKLALEAYLAQGNRSGAPAFYGLLAELEAMRPDLDSALAAVETGFALAEETGEHYTDPYLHRLRGEILLATGLTPSAEEAFQTALAIARGQGARGYALLASLALAKLYNSSGRQDDAHVLLASALEGFSPNPEMPEIAEAEGLLWRLSEPSRQSEQVRAGAPT